MPKVDRLYLKGLWTLETSVGSCLTKVSELRYWCLYYNFYSTRTVIGSADAEKILKHLQKIGDSLDVLCQKLEYSSKVTDSEWFQLADKLEVFFSVVFLSLNTFVTIVFVIVGYAKQ